MPHEKRSKEQTWKEDELKESLKEINGERSQGKSRRDKYGDDYKSSKDSSHSQRKGGERDGRVREDGKHRDRDSDRHKERKTEKSGGDIRGRREDEDRRKGNDREIKHQDDVDRRDRRREEEDRKTRHKDDRRDKGHRDEDKEKRRRTDDRDSHGKSREDRDSHGRSREDRDSHGRSREDRDSHGRSREDRDSRHKESERHSKHREDSRSHREDDGRNRRHGKDDGDRRQRDHELDRDEKRRDQDRKHRGRDEAHNSKHGGHDEDEERRHRGKEENRDRRHRDRVDDQERKHREKDGDGERKHRDKDEDRERRHRDQEGERERRHRNDDRERRRRDHDGDRERKHRDRDEDRERSHKDRDRDDRDRKHKYDDKEKDKKTRVHEGSQDKRSDGKSKDYHDTSRRDRKNFDQESADHEERVKRRDGDRERGRSEKDGDKYSDRKHRDSKDHDETTREKNHSKDRGKERNKLAEETLDENYIQERKSAKERRDPHSQSENEVRASGLRSAEKRPSSSTKSDQIAKSTADEEDYGGYDDDFEDYDDDFEDEEAGSEDNDSTNMVNKMRSSDAPKSSNSEMEALYDALNAENERLLADSKDNFTEDSESADDRHGNQRTAASKPRGFINFVAAKQRDMNQKVASKARKRCAELLQIIELDTVHMSLFDLPPVREYDLYMSSFGRTNAQQVYIQTNDDNLERDTQTEDIETVTKWTQHPTEGVAVSGTVDEGGISDQEVTSKYDEGKLALFLQRTSQVMERLLNEENAKSSYNESSSQFSCSEAYVNLKVVEVFRSRQVTKCQFSPSDSSVLLTMHSSPFQTVDRKLDKYGMIGVWNTNDPSQPLKVVASASMPTCCCFSPIKATLVFGGMRDGSLVAWDLREPPTMHHSYMCGNQDWLLRFPTYNTAGVLKYDNHSSPVTALEPVVTDSNKSRVQESGLGLSFQLATLDKSGTINLWVVAEIQETSTAGSETDLGLSPNGKIKLLKSSTISLTNPSRSTDPSGLCTLDLKLNPSNHNHLYVGTDSGAVIHGTRFGTQKVTPRAYTADDMTPCAIRSVDLHPFGHSVLLAGCEDGSLRLHHLSTESPIVSWSNSTNGSPILKVLWSRNCAYIMFVLDANSTIHMWDLLRNDAEPMTSDNLSRANSRIVDMCLSEERTHSRPKMALSYDDGTVQVHLLSSHVSNLQPGEDEQFSRFVEQL